MALFNIFLNEGAIKAATMAFTVSSAINGTKPAINAALKLIPPIIIIHKVPKRSTNTAETIAVPQQKQPSLFLTSFRSAVFFV